MELKKVVLITAAFCLCAVQARPEKVTETVEDFQSDFGVLIDPSHVDEEAANLKAAKDQINDQNEKFASGKSTYGEKLNEFSDLSKAEFEKEKEGIIMPHRQTGIVMPPEELRSNPENDANMKALYEEVDRQSVPESFDGVSLGLVTSAKNQMSCGACAAFAANGLHETCMIKAGAKKEDLDLSEQYLVDCGFNGESMNACLGAYAHAYTEWLAAASDGMAPNEANMTYLDRNPRKTCPSDVPMWKSGFVVKNAIYDYRCNADKMKRLVATQGAVLAVLYASDIGFQNYATGVFQGCSQRRQPNHAVLIVGYGTENGLDYWLVKNSWGENWGENGFAKIKRGSDECQMENLCVTATCVDPSLPLPQALLSCDLSKLYRTTKITGKYIFKIWSGSEVLTTRATCVNSICTPLNAGNTDACMLMCGRNPC